MNTVYNISTKRGVAKLLRAGANLLSDTNVGLVKNQYAQTKPRAFCAIGACREVAYKDGVFGFGGRCGVGVSSLNIFAKIAAFNDQPNTTKEQVISRLRQVARGLEHGGDLS